MKNNTSFKIVGAALTTAGILALTDPAPALAWGHSAADTTRNIGFLAGSVLAARALQRKVCAKYAAPKNKLG